MTSPWATQAIDNLIIEARARGVTYVDLAMNILSKHHVAVTKCAVIRRARTIGVQAGENPATRVFTADLTPWDGEIPLWRSDPADTIVTADWANGCATRAIGKRLGVSEDAVARRVKTLGLAKRTTPVVAHPPRQKPLTSRQEAPRTMPAPSHAPGHNIRASVAARASHTPSPFDNVVYRPVQVAQPMLPIPTTKTCQYPMNDGWPWQFCDEPSSHGPYCAAHRSICWVRMRDRREDAA